MTLPRQILPGSTYLITRRCTQRQFWLKPSETTNQVIEYCAAIAAERTGVQLHAMCAMSNHWHAVATDPHGRLPEFLHWVHKHVAKCINASYGRWEALWASEPPSAVRLESEDDILDKLAYCLANPVSAGLVETGEHWPGVRTRAEELAGSERMVPRPRVFFRDNGPMPESATLRIVPPPVRADLDSNALRDYLAEYVHHYEAQARTRVCAQGRPFLGANAVLAQDPSDRPRTREPRRQLNPRIGARNKWARLEAIRRIGEFILRYRAAYEKWKEGARDIVFPVGTYGMRVLHQAAIADGG